MKAAAAPLEKSTGLGEQKERDSGKEWFKTIKTGGKEQYNGFRTKKNKRFAGPCMGLGHRGTEENPKNQEHAWRLTLEQTWRICQAVVGVGF